MPDGVGASAHFCLLPSSSAWTLAGMGLCARGVEVCLVGFGLSARLFLVPSYSVWTPTNDKTCHSGCPSRGGRYRGESG